MRNKKKTINIYLIPIFISLIFILSLVLFKYYLKSYFYYSLNPNFKLSSPYIHYRIRFFHHYYTIFYVFLNVFWDSNLQLIFLFLLLFSFTIKSILYLLLIISYHHPPKCIWPKCIILIWLRSILHFYHINDS